MKQNKSFLHLNGFLWVFFSDKNGLTVIQLVSSPNFCSVIRKFLHVPRYGATSEGWSLGTIRIMDTNFGKKKRTGWGSTGEG
jgi:hypothetical protein